MRNDHPQEQSVGALSGSRASHEAASASSPKASIPSAVDRFIDWATRGIPIQPVVNFKGKHLFDRYEILRWDEWPDKWIDEHKASCNCRFCPVCKKDWRPRTMPWWMPFNAFLHHWNPEKGATEEFHDHPRWSITICLKGDIAEQTPWSKRTLHPGSIVLRTRRAIHRFALTGDTDVWTLFIVGRRKVRQNTYKVTAQ